MGFWRVLNERENLERVRGMLLAESKTQDRGREPWPLKNYPNTTYCEAVLLLTTGCKGINSLRPRRPLGLGKTPFQCFLAKCWQPQKYTFFHNLLFFRLFKNSVSVAPTSRVERASVYNLGLSPMLEARGIYSSGTYTARRPLMCCCCEEAILALDFSRKV